MMSRALIRARSLNTNTNTNTTGLRWLCSWGSNTKGEGSEVYGDARKYARPSTVAWSKRLHNWVSLIGRVKYPLKQYATSNARFGVHTLLLVSSSPSSFLISVAMWDELAERAFLHLKPEDHIYISGELGSYTTVTEGVERTRYKVTAKELNYVKVDEHGKSMNSRKETGEYIGKTSLHNYTNRLHLWQIFFASPHEWYDKRKSKKDPRQPDFKHKSTGEALWLNDNDPPWVHKQIQLLDSKLQGRTNDPTTTFSPSQWLSDEHSSEPNSSSSTNDWKIFK